MNGELKPEKAKSSRPAWQIVIAALVFVLLLPPAVIGVLTYQAAAQRATIERIKNLGVYIDVEAAEPPDDASMGGNLLALCHIDQVNYVAVAAPYDGDLDQLVGAIADLRSAGAIHFEGLDVTDGHLQQLSRHRSVTSLDLQGTDVTDAGLAHLDRFNDLRRLDLQCTAISDAAIDAIGRAKTLETVILRNSRVTQAGAQRLRQLLPEADIYASPAPSDSHWRVMRELMKRGVHVDVRGTYLRDDDGIRVHSNHGHPWAGFDWNNLVEIDGLKEASLAEIDANAAMAALERCPELQHLSLAKLKLDRATLGRIAACHSLRVLNLDDCQIAASELSQVSKIENLERLRVTRATIDGDSLRSILSLANLRYLHLWGCEIDNAALAQVAPPHSLESLCLWESNFSDEGLLGVMRWPSLTSLDAGWTKVTGTTLDQVENPSPNLVSIELVETEWTDEGMQHLSRWKNLQELRMAGTKVTEASVDAILSLPHLKKGALPDSVISAAGLQHAPGGEFQRENGR
ncbi:MAG TPA: hypothetical protein VMP01_27890 [Pirellulaceae bacterium]|nr:hypothetical protein [Pirellulaceae bacterium]